MRLSAHERELIRELGLRHFGAVPRLFGSRLDDARGGGDIDLLIPTQLPAAEAARKRLDLLADLWIALGERKIDILLDDGEVDAPVYQRARAEAVAV
jgi:predicted nucleotidyltransferase